jgi:hypothetical protein
MEASEANSAGRPQTRRALAAAGLALALILSCCGVGAALSGVLGSGHPVVDSVHLCVGVNTQPYWQVGVTWIAPYLSSLPPVLLHHQACTLVVWPPLLPRRGGFAVP